MKTRIITGLMMIFVVLVFLTQLPYFLFMSAVLLMLVVGGYEWANLLKLSRQNSIVYCVMILLLLGVIGNILVSYPVWGLSFMSLMVCVWALLSGVLLRHRHCPQTWLLSQHWLIIISLLSLLGIYVAILLLYTRGWMWLLFLIGVVAVADSAAYFIGRRWGRVKLAVTISPGKSIEGACAGLISGLLVAIIVAFLLKLNLVQSIGLMILCLITVAFSIAGDLFESLVKRWRGVKDSGQLLPGHGGILDRIDGLTAAAPIFICGIYWIIGA